MTARKEAVVFVLGVIFVAAGAIGVGVVGTAQAQRSEAPLFVAGEAYGVIWSCLPIPQPQPCYGEVLHVVAVRPDGWLDARDEMGARWFVNPAMVLSFQPLMAPARAAQP